MDKTADDGREIYRPVRALDRGLRLIEVLAERGWSTPQELAAITAIDRATIYRLLATLVRAGYAERRVEDGRFVLSAKIRELASGVRDDDRLSAIMAPLLERLVAKIFWPSDFAMLVSGRLRIVASSHHLTTMTFFRGMVGKERPVLESALGRAILGAMGAAEREHALLAVGGVQDRARIDHILRETESAGYAAAVGTTVSDISAIALPVMAGAQVAGAINLVFFRSALTPDQAAKRYLEPLRATVREAEQRLSPS